MEDRSEGVHGVEDKHMHEYGGTRESLCTSLNVFLVAPAILFTIPVGLTAYIRLRNPGL